MNRFRNFAGWNWNDGWSNHSRYIYPAGWRIKRSSRRVKALGYFTGLSFFATDFGANYPVYIRNDYKDTWMEKRSFELHSPESSSTCWSFFRVDGKRNTYTSEYILHPWRYYPFYWLRKYYVQSNVRGWTRERLHIVAHRMTRLSSEEPLSLITFIRRDSRLIVSENGSAIDWTSLSPMNVIPKMNDDEDSWGVCDDEVVSFSSVVNDEWGSSKSRLSTYWDHLPIKSLFFNIHNAWNRLERYFFNCSPRAS